MSEETYTVVGMTCDHCARSVTQEVRAVDGVADVRVDVAAGRLSIVSDQPVPLAAVQAAVEEAGYSLAT